MTEIIPYSNQYKEQTIKFVLSILEDEFGYTGIERPDLYDISNIYQQDSKSNFWLAVLAKKVVGTIALKSYGEGRGLLKRMYVAKEIRSKGVGQQLMDTLLNFAQNSSYQIIYTSTVEEFKSARNFYKKNDFIEIEKPPEDLAASGDNVFLELKL